MFDADRPIVNRSQDRLNRAVFATHLARCLLDHNDTQSFVVGLYGGWGAGKTSVINLVLEELQSAASNMLDEEKPILLNFSPWSYSGQNQLIYSFFRRLSSALRSTPYLENADQIIHLLELYVSFFTHQAIPKSLRTKRSLFKKLNFKGREEVYGWESGRDLTLVKAELNELLCQQKHKIIIFIDNLSSLYPAEIKQIFQIIKSMGDYANTLYVLAFDKTHIVQSLNQINTGDGEKWVEKIVQLPFDIPPILQQDLEKIFADRLSDVIAIVPEDAWNKEYWADIYYSSLRFFFDNCRDITRYVNTLRFSYSRLRNIVNPVDFFALTAIEVFLPAVYFGIRDNKDLFTDLLDNVYVLNDTARQKDKMRCDEILARADYISRDILLALFLRLFPRLRHIYEPTLTYFHSNSIARKSKRICSPDLFDIYFRLSMQPGQIPESEFHTLLSLSSQADIFDQALTRLNQDDRIIKFLDQLDSNILQQISREQTRAIINALLDNGDLFPPGISGPLSLETPMRIHRIIHRLLQQINNTDERFSILQEAIAKTNKSLYSIVHELTIQAREHQEEEDTFLPLAFRDLTPDQLESLYKLAVTRIVAWADNGRLSEHPKLVPILYAWFHWGNAEDCRQFVAKMTNNDRGYITFLTDTLDKAITQAMVEYEKSPAWENYLDDIAAFIPPQTLVPHAKILFEDNYFEKLREREQLALVIFLDLMKADTKKIIPKTTV